MATPSQSPLRSPERLMQEAFDDLSLPLLSEALQSGASPDQMLDALPGDFLKIQRPALWQSIYRAEPESVDFAKALLEAGAKLIYGSESLALRAIHHCCSEGVESALEKARLCIAFGDHPNAPDFYGRSPAHIACWRETDQERSPALLQELAFAGADLGARDSRGLTPLDLAIETANWSAFAMLLERGQRVDTDHWRRLHGLGKTMARHWPAAQARLRAFEERGSLEAQLSHSAGARPSAPAPKQPSLKRL